MRLIDWQGERINRQLIDKQAGRQTCRYINITINKYTNKLMNKHFNKQIDKLTMIAKNMSKRMR